MMPAGAGFGPSSSSSSSSLLQLPSRNTVIFVLLSLLWYSTSFLSSSTSKALLSSPKVKSGHSGHGSGNAQDPAAIARRPPPLFPYPVSLTAVQFAFVFSFSFLLSSPTVAQTIYKIAGKPESAPRNPRTGLPGGLMGTLVLVNGAKLRKMVGLSFFNVTGHAMTAAAIQMVPVSTVHTIKALSPLFTVLAYAFFLRMSYPLRTYLSLAPLTVGVVFACSGLSTIEGPKAWLGILLSIGSTLVFVAQNLWTKKLLGHALSGGTSEGATDRKPSQGGGEVKLDKLNILFWSSGVSVILMIPMLVWSDLPRLYVAGRAVSDPVHALNATNAAHSSHILDAATRENLAALVDHAQRSSNWPKIVRLLFSNGVVHFSQGLLAFSVLGLTSPVTYSIASLFKRVFVICFAILWFGQTVTPTQWMGIVLTFIGLYLYNDSKQRPTAASGVSTDGASSGSAGINLPFMNSGKKGLPDLFGFSQSVAAREEEAAMDFGMDKGSRRRTGLLPTTGAATPPVGSGVMGAGGLVNGGGPVWKGMSSTLYSSGSTAPTVNGHPGIPNGHSNPTSAPGGPPAPSDHTDTSKAGPKRD